MTRVAELYRKLRLLLRGSAVAADLDDEVAFHLEMETAKLIRAGHAPAEARRRAAVAFGARDRFREESREARGFGAVERLVREARMSVRRLAAEPSFTVAAVLTLAVGIGATAAVVTLLDAVLLSPLPYPDSERIVVVGHEVGDRRSAGGVTDGLVAHYRSAHALEQLGTVLENEVAVTDGESAERVHVAMLTPDVLSLVAHGAALGTLFGDDAVEGPRAIISHGLWQRRYGGAPDIVGRQIETNRVARTVVGVMPRGFDFPRPQTDLWYAWSPDADAAVLNDLELTGIGRLRPGYTAADAERELGALLERLPERFPDVTLAAVREAQIRPTVQTLKESRTADVRRPLLVLLLLVTVVLVTAWANATNLVLLRAERQRGEIAIARALGAGAGATMRRALVENLVLATIAGAAALALAAGAVSLRFGFEPGQIPRLHEVAVTGRVVTLCMLLAGVTALLLSAVAYARMNAAAGDSLRPSFTRHTLSRATQRTQWTLVGAQVTLALVLLVCSVVAAKSLLRMQRIETGFAADDVVKFDINPPARPYLSYGSSSVLHARIRAGLLAVPGVSAVEAGTLPLQPQIRQLRTQAATDDPAAAPVGVAVNLVTPGYFDALRIPLLAGRTFDRADITADEPGVILGAELARNLFGDSDALGRRVRLPALRSPPLRVIGVAGDVVGADITGGPAPLLYVPAIFDATMSTEFRAALPYVPRELTVLVRTALPPPAVAAAVRQVMAEVDPRIPVAGLAPATRLVEAATARARLVTLLLVVASAAALLIGAIGLWGVVAYALARRAPELAIRLAVGAQPGDIVMMVLRQGMLVAAVGAAAGAAAAFAVTRVFAALLFEAATIDPAAAAIATTLLLVIAGVACYMPARRAVRIDPARLLRSQ